MLVLAVCTGNICRSPALELLVRASELARSGVEIESAGTAAVVGAPVHEDTATALGQRGVDVADFAARALDAEMVRRADLIVTMERQHRSRVVQLEPASLRRSYTLAELARIADRLESADVLGAEPRSRLELLLRHAPALRTAAAEPGLDDVDDPMGGSGRAHAEAVAEIERHLASVLRVLL